MSDEPEIRIRFVPFFLWSATRPRPAWNGRPESWPDPFAAAARCRSAAQPKFRDVVQAEGLPSPGVENKNIFSYKGDLFVLCCLNIVKDWGKNPTEKTDGSLN